MRRLDDQRQAELVGHRAQPFADLLGARQRDVARRRQALGDPDALGHHLVHRDRRGHHARAGVGDAQQLERALHRAVLAVAAVQRDEAAKNRRAAVRPARARPGRTRARRRPASAAPRARPARQQRDLALGRTAAHQHGDLAQSCDVDARGGCSYRHPSAATLGATLPIEPAPITITTSPSRAAAIAAGSSATSSKNSGSTLPATRSARQRAAVGGDDRRLAGRVDLRQEHDVGGRQHLDEVLEAVARARVAVRLEGEHEAPAGNAPRAAASTAAISAGWWP